jgi:hypothetical protein
MTSNYQVYMVDPAKILPLIIGIRASFLQFLTIFVYTLSFFLKDLLLEFFVLLLVLFFHGLELVQNMPHLFQSHPLISHLL